MGNNRWTEGATLVALLIAWAGTSLADTDADRCGAAKEKSAGAYAQALLYCHATALTKNTTVDPACTAAAFARLTAAFNTAEAGGACVTADEEPAVAAYAADADDAVSGALTPADNDDARACAASKLRASGRHLRGALNCYGRGAKRSVGPDEDCLARISGKFAALFAAAEGRGGCTTSGDAATIEGLDTGAIETMVRNLSPVCGDLLLGPTQQCEGADAPACPGLCSQSCACKFPPVCGDGQAELPEQCDDGNLMDGDGCSAACELENASALCAGVTPTPGTAIDAIFVSSDFVNPIFLAAPPLDPSRAFVVERGGTIRILNLADNSVNATPFLDIQDLTTEGGERGLFSMAFDPGFKTNGRFFVCYTNTTGDLTISRYEVDAGNPDIADESTQHVLLTVDHPGFENHNGGQIQFGGDGYLYVGTGDGGGGGDPNENAQSDASLLGKLLRLDVDHVSAPFVTVPPTNPGYVDGSSPLEYIWAKGLRNPWRFSFDRVTGDLVIGDVGQGEFEEIDFQPASSTGGENYGWDVFEASSCYDPEPLFAMCPVPPTGYTFPIYEYPHPQGCAITGGYVYRGCAMPDLAGTYFYADYCGHFVHTIDIVGGVATNATNRTADAKSAGASFSGVVSWGQDARGEIYLLNGNNRIYRMEPE